VGALSLILGVPIVIDFGRTGLVPRLPTAVLSSALMSLAVLIAMCGIVLDSVGRGRKEAKRLAYMSTSQRVWAAPSYSARTPGTLAECLPIPIEARSAGCRLIIRVCLRMVWSSHSMTWFWVA